ncbi:OmpA family protein [Larkinella insperata]|uniref:OmpA family protein n=1 Tax=Larkinella insperata TaxID=332158 RepID=A0ABW3Q6K5_9BACT|nr:OmpA family protein [Larkinella insperata]
MVGRGLVVAQSGPRLVRTHVTDFILKALDERTRAEIPATYRIKVVLSKREFDGQSLPGQTFQFSLGKTDTLIIKTTAKGYYPMEEVLLVPCDTCANYEHLALMEKVEKEKTTETDSIFRNLKVNDKIRLDNVYFDQSSYILRKESYPQLDKLLNTLNRYSKLVIEIAGHTDNVGDRRLNQLLSENRARVITNYLIQRGVAAQRLQYQGYGDTRPAAPNDNEANKKKNRRVEFTVLAN